MWTIALSYLSLIRGKGDIFQKSSETPKEYLDDKEFKFGIILNYIIIAV